MSWTDDILALGRRGLHAGPVELGQAALLASVWNAERPIYYVGPALVSASGHMYAVPEGDRRLRGVQGSVIVRDLDEARDPAALIAAALHVAATPRGRVLVGLSDERSPLGAQLAEVGLFRGGEEVDLKAAAPGGMLLWYEAFRGHFTTSILGLHRADVERHLRDKVLNKTATTLERLVYGDGTGFMVRLCETQRLCAFCGGGPATHVLHRRKQAPAACCGGCGQGRDASRTRLLYVGAEA